VKILLLVLLILLVGGTIALFSQRSRATQYVPDRPTFEQPLPIERY
jgi:predicted ribosomally synthesized peptide with SipW-like signal peptide